MAPSGIYGTTYGGGYYPGTYATTTNYYYYDVPRYSGSYGFTACPGKPKSMIVSEDGKFEMK